MRMNIKFWSKNLKGGDDFDDLAIDGSYVTAEDNNPVLEIFNIKFLH
jgi:hypothetical protein